MNLVKTFLEFYEDNEPNARQVVSRLLDELGFSYQLVRKDGKTADLMALMQNNFSRNRKKIHQTCLDFTSAKGGWIEISYAGKVVLRAGYDDRGRVRYQFGRDDESPDQTLADNMGLFIAIRKKADKLLDEDFLAQAVDLICGFFARLPTGGYRIEGFVGNQQVTRGDWLGDRLELDVLELSPFFDFALVTLQGLDATQVSIQNTLEMMRFYNKMQEGLKRMAEALTEREHRLEIKHRGNLLFAAGYEVTPTPTEAFGNTEIRIDLTLEALAQDRSGKR